MQKYSFVLQYKNPNGVIFEKERRSKLLKTTSELYLFCDSIRKGLLERYPFDISEKRMDFHTELVQFKIPENSANLEKLIEETLLKRTRALEGKAHTFFFSRIGNAFCLQTEALDGCGNIHITIAYFPKGNVPEEKDVVNIIPSL